jgi:glycosyltransferase involved in cell wall biosynthesis
MSNTNVEIEKFRFTIITSTYNCGNDILSTANSIRNQNRTDIQWIICDGESSPENFLFFKDCEDVISVFISEKDDGIYDAWNKACKFIKGDWVIFLGAGDVLFAKDTLDLMDVEIKKHENNTKLIYGKLQLITSNGNQIRLIGQDWKKMKGKWQNGRMKLPVHPEVFQHKSLFELLSFDTEFKIAGDSDFLIKAIAITEPVFVDITVTKMLYGGTSQQPKKYHQIISEIGMLNSKNNCSVPFYVRFLFKARIFVKMILGSIISYKVYNSLRLLIKK